MTIVQYFNPNITQNKQLLFIALIFLCVPFMAHVQEYFVPPPNHVLTIEPDAGKMLHDYMNFSLAGELTNFDIGQTLEGDYPNEIVYSSDGEDIFIVNSFTNNITVLDEATGLSIANIPVGTNPLALAVNTNYMVVPCALSSDVYVVSLNDYSVAAIIPVNGEPVSVVMNETKAYIGCDIEGGFNDECAIIDLENLELENTIANFPVKIVSYTWTFNNGRNLYRFSKFEVTDDGNYIVAGNWEDKINFYNTTTGIIDYSVNTSLVKNVSKSGDGSTIIGFSDTDIYQIDIATHSLTATVNLGSLQMPFQHIGIANQDGSKAFIALSGNKTAFIDFPTLSVNTITQTYTPSWIAANTDRSKVFSGQKRSTGMDFENETVLGMHSGVSSHKGAISPISEKAVILAFSIFEGPFFYDYSDPGNISLYDYTLSGEAPEGDAPARIRITPDGQKAFIINELSHNMMVFDIPTKTFVNNIDFGGAALNIEITNDGNWAVITTSYLESELIIYDIINNQIATEIPLGTSLTNLAISSDGSKAYVRDFYNIIYVVNLDGAMSNLETEVSCGMASYMSYGWGIYSDIVLTPDDNYLFIACNYDDEVQILNTQTNSIVGQFVSGPSPYEIEFSQSGEYAVILDVSEDTYRIVDVDGASSSVVYNNPSPEEIPIRAAYSSNTNEFGIITFGNNYWEDGAILVMVDPETGEITSTIEYNEEGTGNGLQVIFDENGTPIVLTSYKVIYGESSYDLPAAAKYMAYSTESEVILVISSVNDNLSLIDLTISTIESIPLSQQDFILEQNNPNPASGYTRINYKLNTKATVSFQLFDNSGKVLKSFDKGIQNKGEYNIELNTSALKPGNYYYTLLVNNYKQTKKLVIQ